MTPPQNDWGNICVLFVTVFVMDGLRKLNKVILIPTEEKPPGVCAIVKHYF